MIVATLYLGEGEVWDGEETRAPMFTAAESAEVWDRWQRGEGLKLIGRVFERPKERTSRDLGSRALVRDVCFSIRLD